MTAEKRQTYTGEFKREAVRLVTVHGYGVAEAARNLGINATMLGRWKREHEARENGAFPGKGRLPPDQEELHRLREENKRLRMEREILKSGGLLCQRVELRYAFMAQHQVRWPVSVMCAVMQGSRSGFYAYMQRQAPACVGAEEAALLARVKTIAAETRHSYGSRRMAKQLQADGFAVGRYKARRLMRQAELTVQRRNQRHPVTTDSRHGYRVAPNLLARQFAVAKPNQVWVGDITYVWTAEGWLYLGVLLDLYSRKVVGWAMSQRVDAALVQEALQMALGRRQLTAGLIHHSDRGSQYACGIYQALLAKSGIRCSMSRKGDCLDNAVAERFFGSLKGERTSLRPYASRQEAWDDIIDYIEMFYNSKRLHSYLGYVSPTDFERLARVA